MLSELALKAVLSILEVVLVSGHIRHALFTALSIVVLVLAARTHVDAEPDAQLSEVAPAA